MTDLLDLRPAARQFVALPQGVRDTHLGLGTPCTEYSGALLVDDRRESAGERMIVPTTAAGRRS